MYIRIAVLAATLFATTGYLASEVSTETKLRVVKGYKVNHFCALLAPSSDSEFLKCQNLSNEGMREWLKANQSPSEFSMMLAYYRAYRTAMDKIEAKNQSALAAELVK